MEFLKPIQKSLGIVTIVALLGIHCQAEKEKDFFGFGDEEASIILTGLILNRGFVDTKDGNIIDQVNRVVYQKCVAGQVYRLEQNDCRGIQRGSLYTPNDVILWGATQFAYCNLDSWNCNSRTFPFQLVGNAGLVFPGKSEAFNYCNSLNDPNTGAPGWRVATPIELVRLTKGGRNAMLQLFPDTPEDWFWSSWSRADDIEGQTAIAVSFNRSNFGEEKAFAKTNRNYVRCTRPLQ